MPIPVILTNVSSQLSMVSVCIKLLNYCAGKQHPEATDVEQVGDESAPGVQVRIVQFGKDCIKLQFFKGCLDNVIV